MNELTEELKDDLRAKGAKLVFNAGALGVIAFSVPPYAAYRRFLDKYSDEKKSGPLEDLLVSCCVYPDDRGDTLRRALEQNPGRLISWGGRVQQIARGGAEDEGKEL